MRGRPLSVRLLVAMVAVVLATTAGVAAAILVTTSRQLDAEVDRGLDSRVVAVSESLNAPRGRDLFGRRVRNPLGEALMPLRFDTVAQVVGPDGSVLLGLGEVDLPVTEEVLRIARDPSSPVRRSTVEADGRPYRTITVPLLPSGALQMGRDVSDIEAAKQAILRWLLGIGAAAVAAAAAVAWLVARGLARPIRTLARTTEDIARTRDFSASVPVPPEHEVAQLAGGVNTLLAAIRESRERQARLVQDASHELRTPLTSIRANADLLARGGLDAATAGAAIGDIRAEVEALSRLSSELVELATDARATEDPAETDLVELAREVAERAQRRTGRTVRVVPPPGGGVRAVLRPQQADRAIGNLVDNAIKFSQGDVEVVVREDGVEVRDRGPGISDADKVRAFDRFWRADASRALPGSGLGLAIVKQFADDHDATVEVGDNPGGGATVAIRLPSAR